MTKLDLRCIKKNKLFTNIIFTICMFLVLMATQVLFNIIGHQGILQGLLLQTPILKMLALCIIIGLLRDRAFIILISLYTLMIYFQSVHMQYYHMYVFPQEFATAFKDAHEVSTEFSELIPFFLKALIPALALLFSSIVLNKYFINRFKIRFLGWIALVLIGLYMFGLAKNHSRLGSRPNDNATVYENSYNTTTYYFATQLPLDMGWTKSDLPAYSHAPYPIKTRFPKINIIFLQGESLTFHHMSLYGYHRKTTPFLDSLKANHKLFIRKGVPLGPVTDVALPSFYNMIEKPVGISQILSAKTNLFRMAKANGFTTHFVSVQAEDALGYIKPYLNAEYIDHYKDSSNFGDSFTSPGFDSSLINYLKMSNLNKPNFLVLQQHACHAPYSPNYPKQYNTYSSSHKTFKSSQVDTYDNCVRYVDNTYQEIYTYLEKHSTLPTYFIFDSDHGEGLGEQNGYFGHGNNEIRNVINIPIIIAGFHGANLTFLKQIEKQPKPNWMSQFELSKIVAHLLGYNVKPIFDQSHGYHINGFRLNGTQGFRTLKTKDLKN